MKLGIVTAEQFRAELENCHAVDSTGNPLPVGIDVSVLSDNRVVERGSEPKSESDELDKHAHRTRGRAAGDTNVPEGLRKIIGEESVINGREAALALAEDFGISPSSVSAYAKGATSTTSYHRPNQTLVNYLEKRKQRITKKALKVLQSSLDELTPERLKGVKARDLAGIAKDMSTINNNLSDKDKAESGNKPQFVIYAPQVRDERTYETIVVADNF